jgi:hypothetical protein
MWPFSRKTDALICFSLTDNGVVDGVLDPFAVQYHLKYDSRDRVTSVMMDLRLAKWLGHKGSNGRYIIGYGDSIVFDYYPSHSQLISEYFFRKRALEGAPRLFAGVW